MSEIGDDVVVLRHPGAGKAARRGVVAVLVLAPIVVVLIVTAAEFASNVPTQQGHMPLAAGLIMLGGFLASALVALPGLLMIKREQISEELQVGERGMRLVQTLPGADGPRQATSWQVLWGDVAAAKLRYRDVDAPYDGASIHTHDGNRQDLYARDWQLSPGNPRRGAVLFSLPKTRAAALQASDLVTALAGKGLKLDDDVPRPQDRLAAWLGLGLAAVALVAALIFNYVVEH